MGKLFEQAKASGAAERIVSVAVNANVWRRYDYLWPEGLGAPAVGLRVRVPFGKTNRKTLGFVTDCDVPARQVQLKAVGEVLDAAPQLDESLWRLGEWISEYYLAPLGMTLAAMVPSAVGRHRPRTETVVFLARERHDWPARLGGRQRRALDELYEARKQGIEPLGLQELVRHSGASRDSIRRLRQRELIRLEGRAVRLPELAREAQADPFDLNSDQLEVLRSLEGRLRGSFSAVLLYGVTGSGKTEVYIRAIRRVVEAGKQAILLVPEIALATQTMQRLLRRLPRVAVLHSGLTDTQRAFYYEEIRQGRASAVVGPRSAVFAPARRLGLIIVDEEHESSYKQDTVPRYHGRDVAVKRASLAGVPIILGSATPSLESLRNVQLNRYEMLRLPRRVSGLAMPKLQIVNLRKDMSADKRERLGRTLTHKIAATLDRGEQIILLMNRRGYASYVFCPSCKWKFSCDNCTRLMVFHRATQTAMCHYCQHTAAVPDKCPACRGKLLYFGYGIQRIEDELARKFPSGQVARMDSDTMTSPRQFKKVLGAFAGGELDILLGTQMVAKGLDFPRVSLVGVASADTSLEINDFRSAERTFQLIVQVAGRAGRAKLPGEVVVQTLYEEAPVIRFAVGHDYDGFAAYEMPSRKDTHLPPFTRMIRFVVRHEKAERAERGAAALAQALRELLAGADVRTVGPKPAAVKKIRKHFRFEIQLFFERAGKVQKILLPSMEELSRGARAEIVADVDPVNLL
ncbi:MAG: replication restart helicase PriA [Planctomycetota bacterium]|jgi:primosomal protein N' (replication factor Y)